MASRFRLLSTIFAVGMVVGVGGLMLLPPPDDKEWELFAVQRIADPPTMPCGKQTWPNADRKCLTWTAPHSQSVKAGGTQSRPAVHPGPTRAASNSEGGTPQRITRNPS